MQNTSFVFSKELCCSLDVVSAGTYFPNSALTIKTGIHQARQLFLATEQETSKTKKECNALGSALMLYLFIVAGDIARFMVAMWGG